MHDRILNIENLSKSFNGLKLFDDVNISLNEGTVNALFGSNGSGKTTLFNLIAGFDKPDTGKIHFNGLTIKYHNEFSIAKSGIGKMWQEPTIFPNHTVMQNMLVSEKIHPGEYLHNYVFKLNTIRKREAESKDKAIDILLKFNMVKKREHLAGSLSLGERKLLSISMLLMNNALLFLLDEPFSSVKPDTIEIISNALLKLKAEGKTVFMIEHKIKFAQKISDHCFKIENYKIESLDLNEIM